MITVAFVVLFIALAVKHSVQEAFMATIGYLVIGGLGYLFLKYLFPTFWEIIVPWLPIVVTIGLIIWILRIIFR